MLALLLLLLRTHLTKPLLQATWREQDVALKVLKLPQRTTGARSSSRSEEALRAKVVEVAKDFVQEIEICCTAATLLFWVAFFQECQR